MDCEISPLENSSPVLEHTSSLQFSFESIAKYIETSSADISEFIKVFGSSINLWSEEYTESLTRYGKLISSLGE